MRVTLAGLLLCLTMIGCSSQPRGIEPSGPRIGDILEALPEIPDEAHAPVGASREDAIGQYQRIEGTLPDRTDNQAVERRVADLELRSGDEALPGVDPSDYRSAIARYESLLADSTVREPDEIVYRLARAYESLGEPSRSCDYLDRLIEQHPSSRYLSEAHFRRAEIAFSREAFEAAADDYRYVVEQGVSGPFWQNANYMLAWSLLKLSRYDDSLVVLFTTIATLLSNGDDLDRPSRELLDDALRAVVLAVGYLDGAETLAAEFDRLGKPAWQYLAYARLADELRAQQRFLESVAARDAFLERNPYDPRAPEFARSQIETLIDGDFLEEARHYKEAFIAAYGIDSDYWIVNPAGQRSSYTATLRGYLIEIAKATHADAQASHAHDDFRRAARYYEQIVRTFPNDAMVPEALFLLGESRTDAGDHEAAVTAYQRVVREFPGDARAPAAGYAAILGLDALLETVAPARETLLQRTRIDAQIEYASLFPDAPHAHEALANAAEALFQRAQLEEAKLLSTRLLAAGDLKPTLRRSAELILGHTAFQGGDYADAETHYRTALADSKAGDEQSDVLQWLLASIYKQAEIAETADDPEAAIGHFLRLALDAPGSELAAKGHFDAVAVREGQEHWAEAAVLLADFRSRYPANPLTAEVPARLADLYEKSSEWELAANEYLHLADTASARNVRRQARYRAAQLFQQAERPHLAIVHYARYVDEYPVPADLAVEAANALAQLEGSVGDSDERHRWLERTVALAGGMGEQASDRIRYLGAAAQFELAEDARAAFDAIVLREPLARSLASKRDAMKRAVTAYEAAAGYGAAEFTTASTYAIADTYASVARALLASDRPAGLAPLELEQYEILLEEQALPFEEQAIEIHEINVERSWHGTYDAWVQRSFDALRVLVPGKFDKPELHLAHVDSIR